MAIETVQVAVENSYREIFKTRGHAYDQAMQLCPDAREQEFKQLFSGIALADIATVLDIPSGGGYLQRYLPAGCQLHNMDPCENFKASAGGRSIDLEQAVLPADSYDAVVCLAAIHHISNKESFITALLNALSGGGYLLIGDVAAESGEAAFLDQFAGRFNQTGHQGDYLVARQVPEYLQAVEADLLSYKMRDCFWAFADEGQMLMFCRLLFGLQRVADKALLKALNDFIGVSYQHDSVLLRWQLLYVQYRKRVI